jgi:peptide/nickel transport system permease protein
MTRIAIRRLATLVPLVWLVATLTFLVVQLAPGSYADTLDHPRLTPEARDKLRAAYGLDRPLGEQYLRWLASAATGDLGSSYLFKEPVSRVILRALPPTMLLPDRAARPVLGVAGGGRRRRPYGWSTGDGVLGLGVYGMPRLIAGLLVSVRLMAAASPCTRPMPDFPRSGRL